MPTKEIRAPLKNEERRGFLASALGFIACSYHTPTLAEYQTSSIPEPASRENSIADQLMQLCSPANNAGTGLMADYFSTDDCSGNPIISRLDGPVEIDPSEAWPKDFPRAARWRGWIRPPLPGSYLFHMNHPLVNIFISRKLVSGSQGEEAFPLIFVAGKYYPISIEAHGINTLNSVCSLEWTTPHGMRFLIPRQLLYPPT